MKVWIEVESSPGETSREVSVRCRNVYTDYESAMMSLSVEDDQTYSEAGGLYVITKPDGHTITLQEMEL